MRPPPPHHHHLIILTSSLITSSYHFIIHLWPRATVNVGRRRCPAGHNTIWRLLTPRGPLQEIEEEEAERAQGQAVDRKGALAQEEPRGAPQPCAVLAH